MSEQEPKGPYVYQPYGMQDAEHWRAGRIYAIGGLPHLATVKGLTKLEAHMVLDAVQRAARVQGLGTPISQLSGRPGEPGFEEFKRIAMSWGYE